MINKIKQFHLFPPQIHTKAARKSLDLEFKVVYSSLQLDSFSSQAIILKFQKGTGFFFLTLDALFNLDNKKQMTSFTCPRWK